MSQNTPNSYSYRDTLDTDSGATAAAVDILTKACSAGDESSKIGLLNWIIEGENFKNLRDKIKDAATDEGR